MNIDLLTVATSILTITTATILVWFFFRQREREKMLRYSYRDLRLKEDQFEMKRWEQERELRQKLIEKSEKYIKLPSVSFHYADKERIKSMYDEYFKEPTIKSIISEKVSSKEGRLKGAFPKLIETEIGGSDLNKWISEIKLPETSPSGMFKRYQRETIKNDQVDLTLEIIEAELFIVDEFEEKIKELKDKYDFEIENNLIVSQRNKLQELACKKTIEKLEKASDWVLIEGNFSIDKNTTEFYKLTLTHPVSSFIGENNEITISCLLPVNKIEPSFAGNYSSSIGSEIPLRIYGQVWQPINTAKEEYELTITPLAVY